MEEDTGARGNGEVDRKCEVKENVTGVSCIDIVPAYLH